MSDEFKKEEFKYVDSANTTHTIDITDEDFKLVQVDKNIHDTKFKTKPTTFFKDALKRFTKNKSSVVGACILGVLVLGAIVLPLAIPYDIKTTHNEARFLEPKLFEAGTGWWDGTRAYTGAICDPNAVVGSEGFTDNKFNNKEGYYYPAGFNYRAVLNLSAPREDFTTTPSNFTSGGYVQLVNSNQLFEGGDETSALETRASVFTYFEGTTLDISNTDYTIKFEILNSPDTSLYTNGIFNLELRYDIKKVSVETGTEEEETETLDSYEYKSIPLFKGSEDRETTTFNINVKSAIDAYFNENSEIERPTALNNAAFAFSVDANKFANASLFIKNFEVTSTNANEDTKTYLENVSFKDGNDMLNRDQNLFDAENKATPNKAFWFTDKGVRSLYNGIARVCDFRLDTYEDMLGVKENFIINETDMRRYAGYKYNTRLDEFVEDPSLPKLIEFNFKAVKPDDPTNEAAISSFKVLDKANSPVIKINSIKASDGKEGVIIDFVCDIYMYKYKGYGPTMPKFIFGTNALGKDMLKLTFNGLLYSLLLGLATFIICFSFGLFLGAIEGYYGGWTDIVIQRLTEILSGIPWIVVMTLCILHLGQTFWTFALALCLTGWIGTSGLTRTQFYRFKGREYILASRTLGAGDMRLIFRHILPNSMGTIITSSVLMIPSVIFSEATISYLGLGLKGLDSLGVILSENQPNLSTYPYTLIVPAVIIALIMISFNLFGNGLRDAFNPSLKGSE